MLSNAQQYFFSAPWLVFFPGMCIFATLLGCNVIADGLRPNPLNGEAHRT